MLKHMLVLLLLTQQDRVVLQQVVGEQRDSLVVEEHQGFVGLVVGAENKNQNTSVIA